MADAFIGEIRAFPYSYAPYGWAECLGQRMEVRVYQPLFSLIGFTYGGDRANYFNLPDLRGLAVAACGTGSGNPTYALGEVVGQASETLISAQMTAHNHEMRTQGSGTRLTAPSPAALPFNPLYKPAGATTTQSMFIGVPATGATTVSMNASALGVTGSGQPHNNCSPFVVFRYCICVDGGEYPPLD